MGRDKAMVDVAGRPMVEWVADAVRPITNNLLVMGRAGTLAGIACVPDDHPARRGPLAGLATALRIADGAPVLLVAVDQPLCSTGRARCTPWSRWTAVPAR